MHFRRLTYTDDMSSSHSSRLRLSGSEFPHVCPTKLRLILLSLWTRTALSVKLWFLWPFLLETCDLPVAPSAAYWMRRTLQWLIRLRHSVYTEPQLVPRCSGAVRAKRAGLSAEWRRGGGDSSEMPWTLYFIQPQDVTKWPASSNFSPFHHVVFDLSW